jgi:hypothetical protein
MECNQQRIERIRALAWQTLDALAVLIEQVRNPEAKAQLERLRARLQKRLREEPRRPGS